MIGTLAPGGVSIEMAQTCWETARESVTLVPDRSLSFEQALVFIEFAAVKGRVHVFSILAEEGDEVLEYRIELLITAGQRRAMWDPRKTEHLLPIGEGEQPPMLSFEAGHASKLHQGKEHDEGRVMILKGMPPMGMHRLLLQKQSKQGKDEVDI